MAAGILHPRLGKGIAKRPWEARMQRDDTAAQEPPRREAVGKLEWESEFEWEVECEAVRLWARKVAERLGTPPLPARIECLLLTLSATQYAPTDMPLRRVAQKV